MAGARVELVQIHSRQLPEIPPNLQVRLAARTDQNGGWGFRVAGDETNWRARIVLVNDNAGLKDFPYPWHHFADTLRTQNNRPLADYGTQVVPGAECRIWRAFDQAARDFQRDTGGPSPTGRVTVLENAPTAGKPFTFYTDVHWPASKEPGTTAMHEFGHAVRHVLDGSNAHFFLDAGNYWYLRYHSGSSCESTNHGFAFNEGWAHYWAGRAREAPCPNPRDFSIERNVAFELRRLEVACRLSRARMVQVLAQNRGRIHSMADYSNALRCQPKPIRALGKRKAKRSPRALTTLATLRTKAGRRLLRESSRLVAQTRVDLARATGTWRRTLLHGRLEQAVAVRKAFAYLGRRERQLRLVRRSDRTQLRLLATKQRSAERTLRAISLRTLKLGAARLERSGDRAGAELLAQARGQIASGQVDALQAIVQRPGPPLKTTGPTPPGVAIVPLDGAPATASLMLTDTRACDGTARFFASDLRPGASQVHGQLLPAKAGSPVKVSYQRGLAAIPVVHTVLTDGAGNWVDRVTAPELEGHVDRQWQIQALFDGDDTRTAAASSICTVTAVYPPLVVN